MSKFKIFKTTEPVTHIDVNNMITGATVEGIVFMHLGGRALVIQPDNAEVRCTYFYLDENNCILPIKDNGTKVVPGEIAKQYSAALGNGSSSTDVFDHLNKDVDGFAISEFAKTFNIDESKIVEHIPEEE